MSRRIACTLFFVLSLTGCARQGGLLDFLDVRDLDKNRVEMNHPGGPIEEPHIPSELKREAEERPEQQRYAAGERLYYRVQLEFAGVAEKSVQKDISKAFTSASLLERLKKNAPDGVAGLEQRMRADLKIAKDVLQAYGFYSGEASGQVRPRPPQSEDDQRERYDVIITFMPGIRYHIGPSRIIMTDGAAKKAQELGELESGYLPTSLADIGLRQGVPVVADEVLEAVNTVRRVFRSRGYPYANITSARYFVDHDSYTLETEIKVDSGEEVRMGELELRGTAPVEPHYFEAHQNWRNGALWNQDRIDAFRESLRQTGLFAVVEVQPSEQLNHRGERNVVVEVVGGLERTLGGALRYDSDLGFGVLGYWENRNITGRGDKLRVELPIWEDMQELAASYRLPFFLRANQDFLLNGGILHENNDSYKLLTGSASIGIERQLSRYWSGTVRVSGEGGSIEETDKEERDYYMLGLPLSLTFNDTLSLLDAVRGVHITVSGAPYGGLYEDYFSALRTRVDARAFFRIIEPDTLVLALRGVYGNLLFADAGDVPPTIRFYSGGGGSVRGYDYRSIGPRNDKKDPLGGDSLIECSAELRWHFSENLGLVLFTDGGMVYTDSFPSPGGDLLWGAGLGLRYYTVLGPVRFDAATPINGRSDDSSVQLYISIGQSF